MTQTFFDRVLKRLDDHPGASLTLASALTGACLLLPPVPASLLMILPALALTALLCLRHPRGSLCVTRLARVRKARADSSVFVAGPRVMYAFSPLRPAEKPELAGLLLAVAALRETDAQEDIAVCIRRWCAAMRLSPAGFDKHSPRLGETTLHGIRGGVYQDGRGRRAFFRAETSALADSCAQIYDTAPRPMTDEDRARLFAVCSRLNTEGCAAYAYAMRDMSGPEDAPGVFLGVLGIGDALREGAETISRHLKYAGLTLSLRETSPMMNPEAVRRRLRTVCDASAPDVVISARDPDVPGVIRVDPADEGWVQTLTHDLAWARAAVSACALLCGTMAPMLLLTACLGGGPHVSLTLLAIFASAALALDFSRAPAVHPRSALAAGGLVSLSWPLCLLLGGGNLGGAAAMIIGASVFCVTLTWARTRRVLASRGLAALMAFLGLLSAALALYPSALGLLRAFLCGALPALAGGFLLRRKGSSNSANYS